MCSCVQPEVFTKPNRELFGLGVSNIVAGLIGALPGAASAHAHCWPPDRVAADWGAPWRGFPTPRSPAMAIEELINRSVLDQGKGCVVAGLAGGAQATLDSLGILDRVPKESFANNLDQAKQVAARLVER